MNPSPATAQVEVTVPIKVKTKPPFYRAMYFQVLLGLSQASPSATFGPPLPLTLSRWVMLSSS